MSGLRAQPVCHDLALSVVYRPIISGYFLVLALYYGTMTAAHFYFVAGQTLLILASLTITTWFVAVAFAWHMREVRSIPRIEVLTSIANALVLSNALATLHLGYDPSKLSYFFLMAMIFAFASISLRQAAISIAAALAAMMGELWQHAPSLMIEYGFVVLAAALSAVSIAYFLRKSVEIAVKAKMEAVKARDKAEDRLAAAEVVGAKLRRQSLTDSLTKLPNRRAFFHEFRQLRKRQEKEGGSVCLMLLDLDGFKMVNDNHGHVMGDRLLRSVASRLHDLGEGRAFICRIGGDEFSIIFTDTGKGHCHILQWCETLLAKLTDVFVIEGRHIQVSASIGIYMPEADESCERAIQRADLALLHAKRSGKNRASWFQDEYEQESSERFAIEQALRNADHSIEFSLAFQPQYDLNLDRIVCAEVLVRWNSPTLGLVNPDQFIKIAEESGLIGHITLTVIDKTLAYMRSGDVAVPVSINLSGHDLSSDKVIDDIIGRVNASGIVPQQIEFEITESAMLTDAERAKANLIRLSQLGHTIAVDDFGTGYSNFNYLRSLPISKIKIDRSFVENIADPTTENVLRSLVGLSRTLNVHCLVEGIESALELIVAKRVGVQSIQGYLFGRPMPADQLVTFIRSHSQAAPKHSARSAKAA